MRAALLGPMEAVPAAPLPPARYWWEVLRQPKTDISLPHKLLRAKEIKERKKILRENHQNAEVEGAAWLQDWSVPHHLPPSRAEKTSGPFHKQHVAEHCGVFHALFKGAMFTPWVTQRVECSQEDEDLVLVCCGNMVTVSEVCEGSWEQRWSGKEICHYLPPFPAMGTGCHRFIFLLFQPDCPVDFSEGVWPTLCHSLKMGTFSTFDFSRKHEAAMTPAGLACFQCQWGSSVTRVFHQLLGKKCSVRWCERGPVCGLGYGPCV
uniref:Uncharacterized protein n=1 Tax=Otus sunia TaxID=257818 RepID=A0A8C8AIA5_9STRI